MFSKKFFSQKLTIIVAGIVVLFGAFAVFSWSVSERMNRNAADASDFSVVYLSTGDIYFGKLDWLPRPQLKNVWYITRASDQQQLGLAPLTGAFWTPIDEIYLNPNEVVFWTKVKAGSEMARALENPALFGQGAKQELQQQAPATGATSGETSK